MRRRRFKFAALAVWALTGAACGAIGGNELTDAQQVIADMAIGPSDLTVIGAVDHADRRYRSGEPIALSVEVNKPAYVAVLRVMPNGAATLIFPNRAQPTAKLAANRPLRIPSRAGSPLNLAAGAPGLVLFEFIASDRGGSWLFDRKPAGSADFAELGTTTRALAKYIVTSLKVGRGPATAATHLTAAVGGK